MITALFELHQNIVEGSSIFSSYAGQISGDYVFINLLLNFSQSYGKMDLFFIRDIVFHIYTKSPKHERSQQPLDLSYDLFLFIRILLLSIGHCEQTFKIFRGIK